MNEDKVRKIEGLLKKAERAATPEEAEAFFGKAQELMTKWSIDAMMLDLERGEKRETITTQFVQINKSGLHKANVTLLHVIAESNNVKTMWWTPQAHIKKAGLELHGFPSDIDNTVMLYNSMMIHLAKETRKRPDHLLHAETKHLNLWRRSFRMGFAQRIGDRLKEKNRASAKEADEASGGNVLPVLLSRSQELAEYWEGVSKGKVRRSNAKYDYSGLSAGRASANRADIGNTRVAGPKGAIGS